MKLFIILACAIAACSAVPAAENAEPQEKPGILATVWQWIMHPIAMWSGTNRVEHADQTATNTHKPPASAHKPSSSIDDQGRNVTVHCDEQMCTTIVCDRDKHCQNTTCNIYETNTKGECVDYHTQVNNSIHAQEDNSLSNNPIVVAETKPTAEHETTKDLRKN